MEKIVVLTSKTIEEALDKVLKESENYEYNVLAPDKTEELKEAGYALAILDVESKMIDDVAELLPPSLPILLCTEDTALTFDWKNKEYDIIYKPLKEFELGVRISNILKIKILKEELGRITVCDELTGLHNRKYLLDRLGEEISRSNRYRTPVSCMLMDIDYFKVINDMYGYEKGDEVLKKIALILKDHVRKEDIVTRYGDEEFIVGLPNTNDKNAYVLAERIRKAIKAYKFFEDEEEPMHVTISIGIATYPFPHMEPEVNTMIRYAEHALYNAKKQGKNKVVLFSQINIDF